MCYYYTTQALKSVLSPVDTSQMSSGFEATIQACKALGLDLKDIPMGVLQIFYRSGMAFADHPGSFTPEQRQEWRDSVIWPRVRDNKPLPDTMPTLPPIIQNPRKEKKSYYVPTGRPPGRPRKVEVEHKIARPSEMVPLAGFAPAIFRLKGDCIDCFATEALKLENGRQSALLA